MRNDLVMIRFLKTYMLKDKIKRQYIEVEVVIKYPFEMLSRDVDSPDLVCSGSAFS